MNSTCYPEWRIEMNKHFLSTGRRLLLACVLAGLLATATLYVPMMTTAVYACQHTGGGGC
jgi:hypothetical protein